MSILRRLVVGASATHELRPAVWRSTTWSLQIPPPGSFVEVEGRRIHFRLIGAGEVTFVLEAGLGDYSGSWAGLDAGLAEIGQVLVYDRAGLGWSEEGPQPLAISTVGGRLTAMCTWSSIPPTGWDRSRR